MQDSLIKRFMLRWRFDYSDSKPTVYGHWDDDTEGVASRVDKTNLRRASIEMLDPSACAPERCVAECDGWDFVNFEWMRVRIMGTGHAQTVALNLKTRDLVTQVSIRGGVHVRHRLPDEKKTHYAGFGR